MNLEFNCQIDSEDMLGVEFTEDYTTFSIHKKMHLLRTSNQTL